VKLSLLGFFFSFFGGSFRQASAETVAPILTLNRANDVVSRKDVPFGGPVNDALHLGGQIPKNHSKRSVNGQFLAKSQKSLIFDIIKTTEPIRKKFCTVIKTTKCTSQMVPHIRTTNPRWRTAAILKILIFNNPATVQPAETKFCRNMQFAIADRSKSENLHI